MFEKFKKWLGQHPPQDDKTTAVVSPLEGKKPKRKRVEKPETPPTPKKSPIVDAKAVATAAGLPYVNILSVDIDPKNINNGAFELDWNDQFLLNLIRAGYQQKLDDPPEVIVDRWFHAVCRNVVLEVFEQNQADPDNRDAPPLTKYPDRVIVNKPLGDDANPITAVEKRVIVNKPLGDGRAEIS